MSGKRLDRYARELQGRHNARDYDTGVQMARMVNKSDGKRLAYAALIGPEDTRSAKML